MTADLTIQRGSQSRKDVEFMEKFKKLGANDKESAINFVRQKERMVVL